MTFVGEWKHEEFEQHSDDGDGERLYYSLEGAAADTWNSLGHGLSAYLFKCRMCKNLRAHFDSD